MNAVEPFVGGIFPFAKSDVDGVECAAILEHFGIAVFVADVGGGEVGSVLEFGALQEHIHVARVRQLGSRECGRVGERRALAEHAVVAFFLHDGSWKSWGCFEVGTGREHIAVAIGREHGSGQFGGSEQTLAALEEADKGGIWQGGLFAVFVQEGHDIAACVEPAGEGEIVVARSASIHGTKEGVEAGGTEIDFVAYVGEGDGRVDGVGEPIRFVEGVFEADGGRLFVFGEFDGGVGYLCGEAQIVIVRPQGQGGEQTEHIEPNFSHRLSLFHKIGYKGTIIFLYLQKRLTEKCENICFYQKKVVLL